MTRSPISAARRCQSLPDIESETRCEFPTRQLVPDIRLRVHDADRGELVHELATGDIPAHQFRLGIASPSLPIRSGIGAPNRLFRSRSPAKAPAPSAGARCRRSARATRAVLCSNCTNSQTDAIASDPLMSSYAGRIRSNAERAPQEARGTGSGRRGGTTPMGGKR